MKPNTAVKNAVALRITYVIRATFLLFMSNVKWPLSKSLSMIFFYFQATVFLANVLSVFVETKK